MHSLITIVFLLLLPALTCQATKTDSLTALLNSAGGENRIKILQQLSKEYQATDLQKSTEYARLEHTESIKTGNRMLQAEAMNDLLFHSYLCSETKMPSNCLRRVPEYSIRSTINHDMQWP